MTALLIFLAATALADNLTVRPRTPEIVHYPCSTCHKDNLTGRRNPHPNIALKHATEATLTCRTCHGNQKMESLLSLNGKPIAFDDAYQLCGQCHSTQLKDWKGGAHGKRLSGWAEPRVIQNCTGCHNPHAPALGKRWPATRSSFKR